MIALFLSLYLPIFVTLVSWFCWKPLQHLLSQGGKAPHKGSGVWTLNKMQIGALSDLIIDQLLWTSCCWNRCSTHYVVGKLVECFG